LKILAVGALCALLGACGSVPKPPSPERYFHDDRFAPSAERISADDVFAMSDAMRRYLRSDVTHQMRERGPLRGLVDALYQQGQLKLDYDATMTRNAAQAYDARMGNCLSLVIMTAAFAKELGLSIIYQSVDAGETWSRKGGVAYLNGHVNLTLGKRLVDAGAGYDTARNLTVDFLPAEDVAGHRARPIDETVVVAMYMNNRSAEALERGQIDAAYWWARSAILQAPAFAAPLNTLSVVYLHHGDFAAAEQVLADVLARNPADLQSLSNLAIVYDKLGRANDANAVRDRLAALEPYPPYHFFFLGTAAMQRGDYQSARLLFTREVGRANYSGEFHFWLGLANFKLGDIAEARKQIAIAMENSTSKGEHALYEGKLERLRASSIH
jgi:hypothetical protein